MPPRGLKAWSGIKSRYTHFLILGNGASIALHENFKYSSLLQYARTHALISRRVRKVFDQFSIDDFELAIRLLSQGRLLNRALRIRERKTSNAEKSVRNGLIRTIQSIHPRYADVSSSLPDFAYWLRSFHTIVSLNYDLLLYWARMYANDQNPGIAFKDCFPNSYFRQDWRALRRPIRSAKRSVLVFYPHGNLALAVDDSGNERKIIVGSSMNLLSEILSRWRHDAWRPLFVSEGSSTDKLATIYQSPYLTTVLDEVLPSAWPSILVVGWSFRDEDDHILEAALKASPRRIAISVHSQNPNWKEFRDRVISKIRRRMPPSSRPEVEFFDAASLPFAG